jgi:hypothetical protein
MNSQRRETAMLLQRDIMPNNYQRFKPGKLPLRRYKETWVKNKRKNSPEFA